MKFLKVIVLCIFVFCSLACADKITLDEGQTLTGQVLIEKDSQIVFDIGVTVLEIPKEKIIELLTEEKQSEFADEYLKKLKAEAKIVYPTSI